MTAINVFEFEFEYVFEFEFEMYNCICIISDITGSFYIQSNTCRASR